MHGLRLPACFMEVVRSSSRARGPQAVAARHLRSRARDQAGTWKRGRNCNTRQNLKWNSAECRMTRPRHGRYADLRLFLVGNFCSKAPKIQRKTFIRACVAQVEIWLRRFAAFEPLAEAIHDFDLERMETVSQAPLAARISRRRFRRAFTRFASPAAAHCTRSVLSITWRRRWPSSPSVPNPGSAGARPAGIAGPRIPHLRHLVQGRRQGCGGAHDRPPRNLYERRGLS